MWSQRPCEALLEGEAEATDYEDARSGEGRRRLGVCARDLYRLVTASVARLPPNWRSTGCWRGCCGSSVWWATRGTGAPERAMRRRGRGGAHHPQGPEGGAVRSLQSPHDPEATYSGHKGKGYEVQVAETCHAENATQLITHVEVTPSSGSDTGRDCAAG